MQAASCWIKRAPRSASRQRGAAALIVTMVLFFAMLLVAAYANRNLVFDQRSATNQVRSTQAFEAAEAGLEWALAQLNNPQAIDAQCQASTAPTDRSFRQRYLNRSSSNAPFSGAAWVDAGALRPLQPSCLRESSGWRCSCPTAGHPALSTSTPSALAPAFSLQFMAGDKPGVVRVVSQGCTSLAGACLPAGGGAAADATARVEVALALLPALATPPLAALTARGTVSSAAALTVVQADPAWGGLAVHAGGAVAAPNIVVVPPAGGFAPAAIAANDGALAATSPDALFNRHFGLGKLAWARLPGVSSFTCTGPCGDALAQVVGAADASGLVIVNGDLRLDGPLQLGTAQRPVLLVVQGTAQLTGDVQIQGLVHASSMQWNLGGGAAGSLRGALVSEDSYSGTGTPLLMHDRAVLDALQQRGGFARVSGSWRDF